MWEKHGSVELVPGVSREYRVPKSAHSFYMDHGVLYYRYDPEDYELKDLYLTVCQQGDWVDPRGRVFLGHYYLICCNWVVYMDAQKLSPNTTKERRLTPEEVDAIMEIGDDVCEDGL